ncbi:MAG: ABC transporter permease [Gemmatimonadetes bacterium]|jgi:ABC-type transport system involved in multi-copper enzyme maturation permease subunit|nr:ABC transporter permease [Gemmatimonadota bacterium]
MLLDLIKKEIAVNVLSLRFIVIFVLFFGLILVSTFILTSDYQRRQQGYQSSRTAHRDALNKIESLEDNRKQVEELIYNQGVYTELQPQPLSIFVRGLEDDLPSQIHISRNLYTSRFGVRKIDEDFYQNPFFSLFTTPDYGYIVNIVASLLALLFVFDAICGEKERGTLKIKLSNAVPRDLVILSKWIGGYLCLILPFLVSLLAGITYVYLTGAVRLGGESLDRLLWLVAISLLYISVFFTLGLLISTLTHRSSTALIVSLFVWICSILVIPNLAPVIGRLVAPVPTLQKILAEKEAVDRETSLRLQRISRTMLEYGNEAERARERIEKEGETRKKKLDAFFQSELRRQIDISKTLSRISPSASFRYAATELAETGTGLFSRFNIGYKRFQERFEEYAEDIDDRLDDDQLGNDWLQVDELPGLEMSPSRIEDVIDSMITVDLLLMVIFNVIFFMAAYVFFLRYDVT